MKLLRFLVGPTLIGLLAGLVVLLWQQYSDGGGLSLGTPAKSYARAVNRAAPAVVNIYTTQLIEANTTAPRNEMLDRFLEAPRRERLLSSLGSGVIISTEGYLLTSHHVVRDADEILVALADGREAVAQLVGTDPETDLALLQIDLTNLPVMRLSNGDPVAVGDVVLAIGNPLGVGQTVSLGIVSATGRSHLGIATFENFIQTDAAINRGNSGGALVDTHGNLIGINTAILSSDGSWQGIGFATPTAIARQVVGDLIDHGRVIRGWLGVTVQDMTPTLATTFGLSERRGGLVAEVLRDSPAWHGGVRPGDVLVGINQKPLRDGYEAMNIIAGTKPGTALTLSVIRNREPLQLEVVIGTRPAVVP